MERPRSRRSADVEIKALDPDVIVPMRCSGDNFIQAVRAQTPDKLVLATTGGCSLRLR